MTEQEFKQKTKRLALQTIALVEGRPRGMTSLVLGKQLLCCAASVGANYRAACRSKSPADMVSKLAIVEEEGDEAIYRWKRTAFQKNRSSACGASSMKW